MKQYQITFEVPDDFVPEELSINYAYDKGEIDISIADEGFVDPNEDIVSAWEDLKKVILERINMEVDQVPENSVVRVTFPPESVPDFESLNQLNILRDVIEASYKCPCIAYCNNLDVMVDNADDAIKMLNGMIAKIKTRAAVKDTSGIILPK